MNEELKQLYQTVILQHNKEPFYYQKDEAAPHIIEANNPVCGDRFKIYCHLEEGRIQKISFFGYGCAISKASGSILVKNLLGKTIDEARAYCKLMQKVVDPQNEQSTEDQELKAFEAARQFPGRSTCATLCWDHMYQFLNKK